MRKDHDRRRRTLALYAVCVGALMIVLDSTVVTVALPSIQAELGLSGASITWTVNAYLLTYGGCLLLSGRLGDLYGCRRTFLSGLVLFTLASLGCGLANSQAAFLAARAVQGLGGAVVTAVTLALLMNMFPGQAERARAMGIYGFVCAAGGGVGEILGGFVTKALSWHWVFLVNLPIGILVYAACILSVPRDVELHGRQHLDVGGAVAITTALTLLVYAFANSNEAGWRSAQTLALLGIVGVLLVVFLCIESCVREPLIHLRLFRLRNFATANLLAVMWAAATFTWFVFSALYLQRVLGYNPLQVGLAFVPAEMIMAVFSAGLAARVITHFGIRGPLWIGLLFAAVGLVLFARARMGSAFVVEVLPGMVFLGLGSGMVSTPLLLAAMNDVGNADSGLASGIVNTSFMVGGSLGLALLASLAEALTSELQHSGTEKIAALNSGYHVAFLIGALLTAIAAAVGALVLRLGGAANTHANVFKIAG